MTVPIADRALELAQSGSYASVNHVRQQLRREGYERIATDLSGSAINRVLVDAIRRALASG